MEKNIFMKKNNYIKHLNTSSTKITPMLKQWLSAKQQAKNAIVLFRLGDFYEMFYKDAEITAPILNLTLTARQKNNTSYIPMAGFPYKHSSHYISKLMANGFTIAICDQIKQDTTSKSALIKREITRIITPGTMQNNDGLKPKDINYLLSLIIGHNILAISMIDISTGEFLSTTSSNEHIIIHEIKRISPPEIILAFDNDKQSLKYKAKNILNNIESIVKLQTIYNSNNILKQFGMLDNWFYNDKNQHALSSIKLILSYIKETQKNIPLHIKPPKPYSIEEHLMIDHLTNKNLNIGNVKTNNNEKNNLIDFIDHTKTAMGGRYLKKILTAPSTSIKLIIHRQNIVSALIHNINTKEQLQRLLTHIFDIERLFSQLSMNIINKKCFLQLYETLQYIPIIIKTLYTSPSKTIQEIIRTITCDNKILNILHKTFNNKFNQQDNNNIFRKGFDTTLDTLTKIYNNQIKNLSIIENKEKKHTNINNLKIKYHKIFGYCIEVTKTHLHKIPKYYKKKQSNSNHTKFVTTTLQNITITLNDYNFKKENREKELLQNLRNIIIKEYLMFINISNIIAELDVMLAFAHISHKYQYTCPKILPQDKRTIEIINGKHPVMEALSNEKNKKFISNNIFMNKKNNTTIIITGPNMGGKSTIIRQIAIIQILAQSGCFVPAKKAIISLCDRIFLRASVSDAIYQGNSTFMIEMNETSNIIHNATSSSLILLDEIGRGTSTFDGLSLASSIIQYIHKYIHARTIFTTHYYEITILSKKIKNLTNMHVSAYYQNNQIKFPYKLQYGSLNKSYGIEVAKLAGLPNSIIQNAQHLLSKLNNKKRTKNFTSNHIMKTILNE